MANILEKIAAYKKDEVKALKSSTSLLALRDLARELSPAQPFTGAVSASSKAGAALITEVKKASPSKGLIRADFDPVSIARDYKAGGAACLSVLTDEPGFQGSNAIFKDVRQAVDLPLLRKDFMIDPIQIAESRVLGADAILVILAMVDDTLAERLMKEARDLGMDSLVETHDEDELARAVHLGADLIGINNRDLKTFHTTLDTFARLSSKAPTQATLIAESGIFSADDILQLTEYGADGFLVGESLMRQKNVLEATQRLRGAIP